VVGGKTARRLRILHRRTDELDLGDRCLCEHQQGIGAASQLSGTKPGAYTALYQCTDAALLAKAVEWMATDPKCANQAFNITNSDLIRWQNLWPKFAKFFGMELAPPLHINLARSMADKGPIWEKIVEKNGLQKFRFEEIAGLGLPGRRIRIGLRYCLRYQQSPPFRIPRPGGHRGDVSSDVFRLSR
jgi:hypothetical protein